MLAIAIFNDNWTHLYHCQNILGYLNGVVLDITGEYDKYEYNKFLEYANIWDYRDLKNFMGGEIGISIRRLEDILAYPDSEVYRNILNIFYDTAHLKKSMLQIMKQNIKKLERSSNKYKLYKDFYKKVKQADNPVTLTDLADEMINTLTSNETNDKHIIFYSVDNYIEYVFNHK